MATTADPTPRELPEPDALVLAARLAGITMERDQLSAQVKQLSTRLAESEARAEADARKYRTLRENFASGRHPCVTDSEDGMLDDDAAIAQEAGREAASA